MRRMLSTGAIALAVAAIGAGQIIRDRINMVPVYTVVETSTGAAPPVLKVEDFEIVDNGAPRPIVSFSADPVPLSLVVLVDLSRSVGDTLQSTRGPSAKLDLKSSVGALVAQLKDRDRVRLGRIGAKVSLGPFLGADAKSRTRAIQQAVEAPDQERGGPSPIWDAIDAAVTALEGEPGRRAILVVSDGMATGNRHSLADVASRAAIANVSVSAIGFEAPVTIRQSRTTVINVKPEVLLQGIAGYTGGLYRTPVPATPPDVAPDPFATILPALRQCYTLGIVSDADGKPHQLEVRVKRPDLTVTARKVYVANR